MLVQFNEFIRSTKNKPFSFIVNCVGMSLAFTAVIIMFTYVRGELNHDGDVKNRADIVRIKNGDWGITPGAYGPWLENALPEMIQFCRVLNLSVAIQVPKQDGVEAFFTKETVLLTDSLYPSMFSLRMISGDAENGLETVRQVMLSQSMARKLFGETEPLGKELVLGENVKATVTGIFEDIENQGLRSPKIITNLDFVNKAWQEGYSNSWWSSNWETYFTLVEGTDRDELTRKYRELYADKLKSFGYEEEEIRKELPNAVVENYEDIYFTPQVDFARHGNRSNLDVLILIALLVLGVSIINYVNMATARLADKSRIIGVKRTLGAGRGTLIYSIIFDSVVTCFLAMLVAAGIVWMIFPYLAEWIGCGQILYFDTVSALILFLAIPLGCGLLSGIFPAFYLTRMNRLDSMNSYGNESAALRHVKGGLMVLQFAVSIGLIISTLFINKQVNYMKHVDPGYNRSNVVVVQGHGEPVLLDKFVEFRNILLQDPSILKVAAAKEPIYNIGERGSDLKVPDTGGEIGGHVTWIDEYFMDLMGLKIVEGEAFRKEGNNTDKYIINQQMAKQIAAGSATNTYLSDRQIGVVKDFNFASMHQSIEPMYLGYLYSRQRSADAYIRIDPANKEKALAYIEQCYKRLYPDTFYQYSFMDDDYVRLYGDEDLFAHRLLAFTTMSIVIACLGLLAFVAFFIEQKTKSIGVRKVMGATEVQILILLNRNFVYRLIIAFVIACPCVYFMMYRWLSAFAYQTEQNWWVFILAFVIMIMIAILSVCILTWRAAAANPVDALKRE